ncbi:MAG: DUF1592 domain-containing protein [Marinagarivorans sp.]|nr:DUF1592 domain-containing protein [Marinagarivorans sp.]
MTYRALHLKPLLARRGGSSSKAAVSSSSSAVSSSSKATISSSSRAATSSSSLAGVSIKYSDYVPDALKGAQRYSDKLYAGFSCETCHGLDKNADGKSEGTTVVSATKLSAQDLFLKIQNDMPTQIALPSACVGQCAADLTAFILAWAPDTTETVACDASKPLTYSPRRLQLLTIDEYQNTLEDLLGLTADVRKTIVADAKKGDFPNNTTTNVDEVRANKYWTSAESIAAWAVENNKPFPCGKSDSCYDKFVDDFAYKLYRRLLTTEEKKTFETIFNTYAGGEGMELALVTALNSPNFLYRSELGDKVSTLLATAPASYYRPVMPYSEFTLGTPDATGYTAIPYYLGGPVNYKWTGNDIISVSLKAIPGNGGEWPSVTMKAAGKDFPTITISSKAPKTYRYSVTSTSNETQFQFNSSLPNGASVYVSKIVIGKSELYTPARGDEAKMKQADADSYMLNPFEYASLLAFTLTGTTPDATLLDAAANDGLHYQAQIRAQVERLIDSPRGRERMGAMAGYWFGTDAVIEPNADRDLAIFPKYTAAVRASMAEEVRELFREIVYGNRPFESLYSGDFTMLNSTLASYYGINSASTGPNKWVVAENLEKRGGILTSGAFMATYAHPDKTAPIIRAVRVREKMMCQHVLPPPLLVEDREALLKQVNALNEAGQLTTRGYYEGITDARSCDGCHKYQINPMFGTEDFDQVGQWRSTQKSYTGMTLNITNDGLLYGPDAIDDQNNFIPFKGAKGLSKELAKLPGTEECLIEKSFRFVTGMPIKEKAVAANLEPNLTTEQANDFACVANKAKATYKNSNHSVRAVITEMVMQDLLRYRKD